MCCGLWGEWFFQPTWGRFKWDDLNYLNDERDHSMVNRVFFIGIFMGINCGNQHCVMVEIPEQFVAIFSHGRIIGGEYSHQPIVAPQLHGPNYVEIPY